MRTLGAEGLPFLTGSAEIQLREFGGIVTTLLMAKAGEELVQNVPVRRRKISY